MLERAAELAVAEANDAGGLDGRSFGMVFCTDEANPDYDGLTPTTASRTSPSPAGWSTRSGVPAVFGPTTSARSEAVFEALRGTDTLFISPSATSPRSPRSTTRRPSDQRPGFLWRTVPPDSLQGRTMAMDMRARGVESVAVIAESGIYGEGLAAVFVDAFTEMGGEVEGDVLGLRQRVGACRSHCRAPAERGAGGPLHQRAHRGRAALPQRGGQPGRLRDKGIFLSDTAATPDLLVDTPARSTARSGSLDPRSAPAHYDQFIAAYSLRFPGQNPRQFGFIAQAYDAAWMILYGSAWALFRGRGDRARHRQGTAPAERRPRAAVQRIELGAARGAFQAEPRSTWSARPERSTSTR